ncbi:Uncharacterised protein [Klebsiella pneumoniae]|uniref:Uncharacterized protein n=1 Tax=Klebsiella pneumoniae TaxID=573 RepID=A0A509ACI4_KLEPN|nr:Uncharacterised protein [Klebsiella pneumoniae]
MLSANQATSHIKMNPATNRIIDKFKRLLDTLVSGCKLIFQGRHFSLFLSYNLICSTDSAAEVINIELCCINRCLCGLHPLTCIKLSFALS